MAERDKLLTVASKTKDKTDFKKYKAARNIISNIIHTARRTFHMDALNKNKTNSKIL